MPVTKREGIIFTLSTMMLISLLGTNLYFICRWILSQVDAESYGPERTG